MCNFGRVEEILWMYQFLVLVWSTPPKLSLLFFFSLYILLSNSVFFIKYFVLPYSKEVVSAFVVSYSIGGVDRFCRKHSNVLCIFIDTQIMCALVPDGSILNLLHAYWSVTNAVTVIWCSVLFNPAIHESLITLELLNCNNWCGYWDSMKKNTLGNVCIYLFITSFARTI